MRHEKKDAYSELLKTFDELKLTSYEVKYVKGT
jgi:hypothetical protein